MASFTPPMNATEVPAVAADTRGPARRLLRWHGGNPRGRNVYFLSDGTVTETDPDGQTVFWTDRGDGSTFVEQAWWGSTASPYEVTAEQAAALTAAGYTVS